MRNKYSGRPKGFCTRVAFAGADDGIRTELRPLLYAGGGSGSRIIHALKSGNFRAGCSADADLRWHHLDGL